MNLIKYSTRFKKDIKRYASDDIKINALYNIIEMLRKGMDIPQECRPHLLKGKYSGCWECHIQSDFLLIWIDSKTGTIWLERLGSHSELFR